MADILTVIDEPPAPRPPFEFRVHHAGLSVPDLEASIAWYRDMLGFSVEFRADMQGIRDDLQGFKNVFLRCGQVRLELFEVPNAAPLPDERLWPDTDLNTHGMKHVALEVSDLDAAFDNLTGRGVQVAMPIMRGDIISAAYIRDNSGILVELLEVHDTDRRAV